MSLRAPPSAPPGRGPSLQAVLTVAVVVGLGFFILLQLQPRLIATSTTAAGGDMGAHVWGPAYLRDHLLPHGRVTGWAPDWYLGFPALHYYFPLPSLLIVLVDVVFPYGVAFKIVTVLGLVTLPGAAATLGHHLRLPFPTPALLACGTVPFVFDTFHTIWGGNAAATLAGEFSFSIGLSAALFFLAALSRALETGRGRALAGVLFAVTALCHLLPAGFAVVAACVLLMLRRPDRARWGIVLTSGLLGFAVAAFWFVPFIARLPFSNDMGWERTFNYIENLFPYLRKDDGAPLPNTGHLKAVFPLAAVGALIGMARLRRGAFALVLITALAGLGFRWVPEGPIWNARLLPFWYLGTYLLAALAVAELSLLIRDLFAAVEDTTHARRHPAEASGTTSDGVRNLYRLVQHEPTAVAANATHLYRHSSWSKGWQYLGASRNSHPSRSLAYDAVRNVLYVSHGGEQSWEVFNLNSLPVAIAGVVCDPGEFTDMRPLLPVPFDRGVLTVPDDLAGIGTLGASAASGGSATDLVMTGAGWRLNEFLDQDVVVVGGTGVGQRRRIGSNTAETLKLARAAPGNPRTGDWATRPDVTSVFKIVPSSDFLYFQPGDGSPADVYRLDVVQTEGPVWSPVLGALPEFRRTQPAALERSAGDAIAGEPEPVPTRIGPGFAPIVTTIGAFAAVVILTGVPLGVFSTGRLELPGSAWVPVPKWIGRGSNFVPAWAKWNFSGYERKPDYPEFRELITTMDEVGRTEGCGRAMWEYEPELNRYGTPMAPMLLPYFTDGCIGSMEGLFFESSASVPYHFLNQSELSKTPSRAMRGLPYRDLNVDAGVEHLKLLGVKYYLALSPETQEAAERNPGLELVASTSPYPVTYTDGVKQRFWQIYEVDDAELVAPLAYEPVVVEGLTGFNAKEPWLEAAVAWYQDASRWEIPLASAGPAAWARIASASSTPPAEAVREARVTNVRSDDDGISFDVDRPGTPVVVKASYFPNWKAKGADGPWRITPNLMVVVPTSTHVDLHYGWTGIDIVAWGLTVAGLAAALFLARRGRVRLPAGLPPSPEEYRDPFVVEQPELVSTAR